MIERRVAPLAQDLTYSCGCALCAHGVNSLFVSILDEMNVRVWYPHRAYMPTLTNFRHSRTIAELDEIVRQIVRTRRAEVEARGDAPVEGRSPDLLGAWPASLSLSA